MPIPTLPDQEEPDDFFVFVAKRCLKSIRSAVSRAAAAILQLFRRVAAAQEAASKRRAEKRADAKAEAMRAELSRPLDPIYARPVNRDGDGANLSSSDVSTLSERAANSASKSSSSRRRAFLCAMAAIIVVAAMLPLMKGGAPSINPLQSIANSELQSALNRAISDDPRNRGLNASAYYQDVFAKSVIVFDLKDVSGGSRLDVFRLFLDFASNAKDEYCETVAIAFRGRVRFKMDGAYFRELGRERNHENPVYVIRTFPENLRTPDGARAYPEWSGGLLGVLNKQMNDFNDVHDKWYLDALKYSDH